MYEKEDRREVRGREGNVKMLLFLICHTCKGQHMKWKKCFYTLLGEVKPL